MTSAQSAQQIDPVSGVIARLFLVAVALVSVGVAVALAISNGDNIQQPVLQVVGIALLVGAYVSLFIASDPYRKRVSRRNYAAALVLVILAGVFDALSQLGTDSVVRDDWGSICIALVLMVAGPYRPPLEIAVLTVISLAAVAAITIVQQLTLVKHMTVIALAISCTPVFALGFGAAIFSVSLTAGLREEKQRLADARNRRDALERREAIEQFLGDDIESLRTTVLPFLRAVRSQDALTEADIVRSAELQALLRATLSAKTPPDRAGHCPGGVG